MPVIQAGQVNTTALVVPDLYVQIIPPQTQYLNGLPTNILGIVGTATWGPVNSPTVAGNVSGATAIFGPLQNRTYDLMTHVNTAAQQGANNFKLVRVTDGTDVAATVVVLTNCIGFTSKWTGSFGNNISVTLSAGTQANTQKVVVSASGLAPEAFDNIGAGLTGNALWAAIAAAINSGTNVLRGPSNIIVATAGAGATSPAAATYTLTGGTDGASGVTTTNLVGVDVVPRSGMYALRNTQTSVALLADCLNSTTWSTQVAYGLSEGTYMIMVGPSGDNIANAVSTKASAGIDSYAAKLLFGDWVYWLDTYNNVLRVVSPQGFIAGYISNASPQLSSLNKPLQGIVGTQKSYANQQYASADLQTLVQAGIDVITNPVPGGSYFAARFGHNTSSNPLINQDAYTRMTNYIAYTLNAGMGIYVGQVQSASTQAQANATLSSFFDTLWQQGLIGNPSSPTAVPYSITLNASNNPQSRVALGYMQADVAVQFLAIVEKFLINVQGGASVSVQSQGVSLAPSGAR
ncbi:MAG: phage tail protein [Patescibacteria group bacterium]|nr:phage tail protein [Patescibacteria group bacterium]